MLDSEVRATADEYHFVTRRLAECLTDVLNICESRGQRIPPYRDEASRTTNRRSGGELRRASPADGARGPQSPVPLGSSSSSSAGGTTFRGFSKSLKVVVVRKPVPR